MCILCIVHKILSNILKVNKECIFWEVMLGKSKFKGRCLNVLKNEKL